jgi:peptidoglycan hydrolase CwlO-like protein
VCQSEGNGTVIAFLSFDNDGSFVPCLTLVLFPYKVDRTRFQGPVIGPIGAYVKIVAGKEKFAPIAEFALGNGTLDRFIVTNDHDRKTFQKIRRNAGCKQDCGILQQQPHARYNIPAPPVGGIETVASVLHISDDLVFNCLVDSGKIEEKALSASKDESEKLLLTQGNDGKYSIRGKIRTVFCLPQGDNWNVKNGTIALNSNDRRLCQTIGVDKSAALAETGREAQAVKEDMDNLSREESRLEHEHTESMRVWNKKKKQMRKNEEELDKIQRKIDALKEEEVSAANFDTDTSEYEQVVAEEEQALEKLKDQESTLAEQIKEKEPTIDGLKEKLNEVKVRNEKVLEDMKMAEEELAIYVQNLSQRQEKLEKKRHKIKQYTDIIEKRDNEIMDIDAQTNKYLVIVRRLAVQRKKKEDSSGEDEVMGTDYSQEPTEEELAAIDTPDPSTVKDPKHYQTRLERLKKKIQNERERRNALHEDRHEVYEKLTRAKEQLSSKMKQIAEIDETSANLNADLKKRKQRWRQFRQHIALITDIKFNEILNDKGSSGTIDYDHKLNSLNLCVQKDSSDANSQQKDVKALSGGERSYTTIALLLALGESLETPFRVLDEFDVFLDPITRKLTIDSLIKMATGKEMRHRQFIFITPQVGDCSCRINANFIV